MHTDQLTRVELAVGRAGDEARTVVELLRAVHASITALVPADRWCGFAVDPATLFATNGFHDEGIPFEHFPRLLELEHGTQDCNHIPALARSASGVATLHGATDGDPAVSARWRDVLQPSGLPHELRAAIREHGREGRTWGALVLLRGSDGWPFSTEETDAVARLTPVIATGLRRVLLRQHLDHADDAREAGILVVGGDPPVIHRATDAAVSWLEALDDGGCGTALPTCVLNAVQACRSGRAAAPTARARTRTGRWLTITAERLHPGTGDGESHGAAECGVVLQPSRPAEIAAIVGAAHRLTPREADVVVLVAAGRTNREIARALGVSAHTVGDHLKNIFAKLDVRTRGEMTSKLYHDHYLPREMSELPAGVDGWYLPR